MKKQITKIALAFLLLLSGGAFAQINLDQQVIGSAGGFHQVPGGNSYSYTVGETVVTTQATFSVALILTQGFQQTFSTDSLVEYTTTNESCPGASDGSITITNVLGCPGPYSLILTLNGSAIADQNSLETGNYFVEIEGSNACTYSLDIFVGINNTQNCEVIYESINESCPGAANGALTAINDVQGYPGPYSFVVSSTIDSLVVREDTLASGIYNVVITASNDSTFTTQIEIGLDSDEACELKFYSGITPNGDGNNDIWLIDNIHLFPDNTVQIFNRWGNESWSTEGYDNENVEKVWSGLDKNGVEMADATYFYVAVIGGQTYKGFIELTR
jgi:gliding motility-associated-like protein